jgi:hypothetical protein
MFSSMTKSFSSKPKESVAGGNISSGTSSSAAGSKNLDSRRLLILQIVEGQYLLAMDSGGTSEASIQCYLSNSRGERINGEVYETRSNPGDLVSKAVYYPLCYRIINAFDTQAKRYHQRGMKSGVSVCVVLLIDVIFIFLKSIFFWITR